MELKDKADKFSPVFRDWKRDLQRMDSTFDMRGGLPLPYARADKAFRHF